MTSRDGKELNAIQDFPSTPPTRHLFGALIRQAAANGANDNSLSEAATSADSPQNGEVDVVTVDNCPDDTSMPPNQGKSPIRSAGLAALGSSKRQSSPSRYQSIPSTRSPRAQASSPRPHWTSPKSVLSSPGRAVAEAMPNDHTDATPNNNNRRFEACILNKAKVWLPVNLLEQIFNEVVSMDTWNNVLSDADRAKLSKMLPEFPESNTEEKQETLRRLFAGENFKFGNPVRKVQRDLHAGYLCMDVYKHLRALQRAKYRDYRHQRELWCHRMLKEVLISRQELLEAAQFTAPDEPFKVKRPRPLTKQNDLDEKVTKKYRKILKECRIECGDVYTSDEDDDVLVPKDKTPNKRKPLGAWYKAPSDLLLPRFTPRVQSTFDPKPITLQSPTKEEGEAEAEEVVLPVAPASPLQLSELNYMDILDKHHRRREARMDHFEMDASNITLEEVMTRTFSSQNSPIVPTRELNSKAAQLSQKRKAKVKDKLAKKRKKGRPPKVATPISVVSVATVESSGSLSTNQEERSTPVETTKDEEDSNSQSLPKATLYPNFFSFLRDMLRHAPGRRLTLAGLQAKTECWQEAPLSSLNVWFMLVPSWSSAVVSMLQFLLGELPSMPIRLPMVDYIEPGQTWGWIGEGRDSDEQLTILFKQWLTAILEDRPTPPEMERQTSMTVPSPIKVRTDFVVRPSTIEEKAVFRAQEHERYEQPHKAYTYRMHGYKSVVGPVKGVYGKETSLNKAREHSLLVSDRPPYVTILSLVRDAVARLPNGEGTRAEVCELLKDSKFLADATDNQINTVVSGALDRLHYEKDPCVKYDGNRKLWIYLHRNRTEDEFEHLHLEQAVSMKAKRTIQKPMKPVQKAKTVKDMQLLPQAVRPPSAMSDTSNDSIISVGAMGMEIPSPSPTRSPASASISPHGAKSPASASSQSPMGNVQQAGKMPQRSNSSIKGTAAAAFQPHVFQNRLASPVSLSGSQAYPSQVQALLTHAAMPSVLVPTSAASGMPGESSPFQAGNSLIKAQLLAPRGFVAQLASQQLAAGTSSAAMTTKGGQIVRNIGGPAGQTSAMPIPSLMMSHLVQQNPDQQQQAQVVSAESLSRKVEGKPAVMGSATSQPITLTLTGAKGVGDNTKTPSSAAGAAAIPAALAFQTGSISNKPGTLPVNFTLTLKGAATSDVKAAGTVRSHGGKTKLPTVGGLLAGLGMPLEGISTPRGGRRASSSTPRAKSPARASPAKTSHQGSPSQTSMPQRRKAQRGGGGDTAASLKDHVFTLCTVNPSPSTCQKGPLLNSPLILNTMAAGSIHQPSASGLVFQSQVATPPQSASGSVQAKRAGAATGLTATQASAIRTLTSLASQQNLQDQLHQSLPSTSGPTQDSKQQVTLTEIPAVPMSVLLANSSGAGLHQGSSGKALPKGAVPVITNPLLSSAIPASLAAGKGVILQVSVGSKLVSAIPATVAKQKSSSTSAPVILTSSALTSSLMTPVVRQGLTAASTKAVYDSLTGDACQTANKTDKK